MELGRSTRIVPGRISEGLSSAERSGVRPSDGPERRGDGGDRVPGRNARWWMAPGRVATVPGGADYELSSRGRDVPGRKCDAGRIQTFLPGRLHERLSVRVLPSETSGRKDGPVRTLLAVAFKRVRASAAEPHLSISPVKENISSASKGARGCLSHTRRKSCTKL